MLNRLRWPMLAATAIGLAAALWAIGSVGLGDVARSAARLGVSGFLLLCLASLGVLGLLGGAWLAAMPGEPLRRLPLFVWARTAREGANDLLPFSQLGGIVVGARTLTGGGIAPRRVHAAMIVDLTTELASQLAFTLFGMWTLGAMLLDPGSAASLRVLILTGAGMAFLLTVAFATLQRPVLRLAGSLASRLIPGAGATMDEILAELADSYRSHKAVAAAFLLNLLAWLASAACAWLALRLMHDGLPFRQAVALESLIFTLRSAAFVVPGALGIQEGAYIALAPLFGLDPGVAVGLSLIKRARDVAIGLPALALWQAIELRSSLTPRAGFVEPR